MDFSENYEKLLKDMRVNFEKRTVYHTINDKSSFFPFKIENTFPEYKNGFYNIFGEFSRILLNNKIEKDFSLENITSDIINNDDVLYIEEGNENYLKKLLKEFIFTEKDELKLLHPSLYLYIPLSSNKHKNGEKELALFLRDIFCSDNKNLIDFFQSNESNHIIIDLILSNVPHLDNHITEKSYSSKLSYVNQLFNEDIKFAIENKKFFLDNMDNFFAFYYFFYISQLILKISRRSKYGEDVEKLYYLLDWDEISKDRKTLKIGYGLLKDVCYATYPRISLISQLNTLLGTEYRLEYELLDSFNELNYDSQQNFLYYLKRWILDYHYVGGFDESYSLDNLPNDYDQLVDILYDLLDDDNKGISYKSKKLFNQNLESIAKRYFLKRRGPKGYVLNINREMLLMITALCVKNKKIKLGQLYKEYEKRGLCFDKYSRDNIESFLTKLNLIEKKSDSRDAKYVKPVL